MQPRLRERKPPEALTALVYLLFCNVGWFIFVMSAAHGQPWIGALFAATAVACHLRHAAQARLELYLLVAVLGAAALWESLLTVSGLLVYSSGTLIAHAAPYWILALWALFTIQLNVLFRWLRGRYGLAAMLGAVAGPLSFRAGAARLHGARSGRNQGNPEIQRARPTRKVRERCQNIGTCTGTDGPRG